MSFDLFVLIDKTDETTQTKWLDKLNKAGIECQFPDGFIVGADSEGETLVQCKLNPPLVKKSTGFEAYEFYFESMDVDKENITDMIASTDDEGLKQKLTQMKSEIQLYSSAGRDDHALIVQCFAAATLADATDGVLFDPQEFGAVHREKVYQVANHHCEQELGQVESVKQNAALNASDVRIKSENSKVNGMSPVLVVLLCILFMAIINIIKK